MSRFVAPPPSLTCLFLSGDYGVARGSAVRAPREPVAVELDV